MLATLGCTQPAEVVIDTRVEQPTLIGSDPSEATEPGEDADPSLARAVPGGLRGLGAWFGVGSNVGADAADTDADIDAEPRRPVVFEPPTDAEQFAALLEVVRKGSMDDVPAAVRNLAEADPNVWPQVREALLAEREQSKRQYKQVLDLIGGDVPNRYGHFELAWKRAHGYSVKLSENWFEDLLAIEPGRITKPLRPVLRDLLLTCALLRASSRIAGEDPELVGDIVSALLDAAYVHEGTFRDEVGRAIDALGDPAVPHLMVESAVPEQAKEGSPEERRGAYAIYCLDRLDRLHPQRAIAAVSGDRRLLAAALQAYALTRDGEAAAPLLDFLDNDAPGVRRAARAAFEAYVTGPLPKIRRKSIRLLGGRTTTLTAELSYREQARIAIRERLARDEPELLEDEPECRLYLPGHIVDPVCERQPERLFRAYVALLDERRVARRDDLVARALAHPDREQRIAMLDTLLTDGGEILAPETIAPIYVDAANVRFEGGDRAGAAQLLRKSAMLLADSDPSFSRALTIDALVLEAEIEGLDERGRTMLLSSAAELDPDSKTVAAGFARLESEAEAAGDPQRRDLAIAIAGLLAGLGALAWIGGRAGPWLFRAPQAPRA